MAHNKQNVLNDVQIEFTDGTVLICSPRSAVYILRGLDLKPVKNGEND